MITCEEFTDQISDYLDGRVPFGDRIGLCMHRLMCVRCRNLYRQLREIVDFTQAHGDPPAITPTKRQKEDLLSRYHDHFESEDASKA